jgi:hypothetical protein
MANGRVRGTISIHAIFTHRDRDRILLTSRRSNGRLLLNFEFTDKKGVYDTPDCYEKRNQVLTERTLYKASRGPEQGSGNGITVHAPLRS